MKLSRSEQKRRIKQVEKLVEELAVLPAGLLRELPVDDEVQELFQEVASLKGGSRKTEHVDLSEDWSSKVVKNIAKELPSVDRHELQRLAFFFAMSRNKQHIREIFRLLQAAQEREAMTQKFAAAE